MMGDQAKKSGFESQTQEQERLKSEQKKEGQAVEISVGKETREAIEEAEIPSGEISEAERKTKEGYTGASTAGVSGKAAAVKPEKLPGINIMKRQVEYSVKKEMKILQKKIRQVMEKSGPIDAYKLNGLIANLRKLQEILASLLYATGDFIKDLWFKFVKKEG